MAGLDLVDLVCGLLRTLRFLSFEPFRPVGDFGLRQRQMFIRVPLNKSKERVGCQVGRA